jgi:hypothetical protein
VVGEEVTDLVQRDVDLMRRAGLSLVESVIRPLYG